MTPIVSVVTARLLGVSAGIATAGASAAGGSTTPGAPAGSVPSLAGSSAVGQVAFGLPDAGPLLTAALVLAAAAGWLAVAAPRCPPRRLLTSRTRPSAPPTGLAPPVVSHRGVPLSPTPLSLPSVPSAGCLASAAESGAACPPGAAGSWPAPSPAPPPLPSPQPAAGLRIVASLRSRRGRISLAAGSGLVAVSVFHSAAAGLLPSLVIWAGERWWRRRSRRQVAAERRSDVLRMCAVITSELRAGRPPRDALAWAAADVRSDLGPLTVAALRYDPDVPASLRRMADLPGAESLRRLAACWQVAAVSGAGLANAVERLADGVEAEEAQRREVAAQLAGPRATARLLAVLPVVGLVLGAALGGHPLQILLTTPYGLVCLLLGLVLEAAGIVWTERIARTAERAA